MKIFLFVLSILERALTSANHQELPRGHGEELGKHRDSDGHVEILQQLPSPQEFWNQYASLRKPVVFRGAAKKFPAFHLWTDQYLKDNYGELEVKLEAKREKDHVPVGERGLGRDTIRSFLETYQQKDSYTVSQLPDPLSTEVFVLPSLMCGSFSERILEANLWLSSGGTRSMLHKDADNAINCLLNGTKDWILIHPENEQNIPVADGDRGYGGFATLDVQSVNLIKYPKFKQVRWQYANMTPGDCLFLPYSYWHQVRSYGSKNMAVSVLFSRLTEFDPIGCESAKLEYTPLSDVNMVWTYPGYGPQTMGNLDPFEMKDHYISFVESKKSKRLDIEDFFQLLTEGEVMEEHEDVRRNIAEKVLKIMDAENKGYVTKQDIEALTIEQVKQVANEIDPDPANTEEYEFAVFDLKEVKSVFNQALQDGHGKLTKDNLIARYEDFGGSAKVAKELYNMLQPKNADFVSEEELRERLDHVLKLYLKKKDDDKSGIFYEKELAEDKEIMKQTQLPSDSLDSIHRESTHSEL
ncbi:hypothetical protein pdam_00003363 [Pocillopora damicornis]|uniref:JmjC domain-containing protein n=1 Tax=Pocillopora damicornis TaxID=46731 RepID=A0A3M6TA40_POCDA|nr:uncharacterized protein LOC113680552 [Pocillopora damicornis]RMX38199.1 hypothetical protein pdam_00003363 [Pocillopora damicornis]